MQSARLRLRRVRGVLAEGGGRGARAVGARAAQVGQAADAPMAADGEAGACRGDEVRARARAARANRSLTTTVAPIARDTHDLCETLWHRRLLWLLSSHPTVASPVAHCRAPPPLAGAQRDGRGGGGGGGDGRRAAGDGDARAGGGGRGGHADDHAHTAGHADGHHPHHHAHHTEQAEGCNGHGCGACMPPPPPPPTPRARTRTDGRAAGACSLAVCSPHPCDHAPLPPPVPHQSLAHTCAPRVHVCRAG